MFLDGGICSLQEGSLSRHLFAGTDSGIFVSPGLGDNWIQQLTSVRSSGVTNGKCELAGQTRNGRHRELSQERIRKIGIETILVVL